MPGAGDNVRINRTVAQRSAAVQAHVVEREEFVAETEERNMAAGNVHHLALAGREITDAPDKDKLV